MRVYVYNFLCCLILSTYDHIAKNMDVLPDIPLDKDKYLVLNIVVENNVHFVENFNSIPGNGLKWTFHCMKVFHAFNAIMLIELKLCTMMI